MKKIMLVTAGVFAAAVILGGIVTCSSPAGGDNDSPGDTFIAFDNTQGVCTAIIYDDYRKREGDIVEVVRAGVSSEPRKWTAQSSCPFYFAYQFAVPGAEENTVIYTPRDVSKNQTAARIDAGKTITIPVPKLENTLNAPGELLSAQSYLIIQNNSEFTFRFMRGSSEIKPENLSGAVVNGGERALYTIEGGVSANIYKLLVNGNDSSFPSTLDKFLAGYVYQFVYNDTSVTLSGNTQLDATTVAAQGSGRGDIPACPAGLAVTSVTVDSVSLSWNAVSGAVGYRIYRADLADSVFYQIGSRAAAASLNYTDSDLLSATAYYYKVSAVNATGESAMSAAAAGNTSDGKSIVTILNLSGVVIAPVKGTMPQTTPQTLSHDQYSVTTITWQTASGGTVSSAFTVGEIYKAVVRLQAQSEYSFAGLGVDAFTYSGAVSVTAAISGQTAVVTITFSELGKVALSAGTEDEFIDKLTWIKSNGEPDVYYVITLTAGISISPQTLNAGLYSRLRNTTVKITGDESEKTITLNANGSLFTLAGYDETNKFTFILDENIKLQGRSSNTASIVKVNQYAEFIIRGGTISGNNDSSSSDVGGGVYVSNGTFTMSGGTISGNTASRYGGGVYVSNGTFTMSGGIISGNTASYNGGGGVYVDNGTFTMSGGAISGNTVSSFNSNGGGGVYVGSGMFTMSGGTISGNTTASYYGGGVYVNSNCRFLKSGNSIIYGNDGSTNTKNTASSGGHAVYISDSKKRNATAYTSDTMDSSLSGYAGGWE